LSIRDEIPLEKIIRLAVTRAEFGIKEYGSESYKKNDIWLELIQELLDQINYSYLQILKIIEANQKLTKLYVDDEEINNLLGVVLKQIKPLEDCSPNKSETGK